MPRPQTGESDVIGMYRDGLLRAVPLASADDETIKALSNGLEWAGRSFCEWMDYQEGSLSHEGVNKYVSIVQGWIDRKSPTYIGNSSRDIGMVAVCGQDPVLYYQYHYPDDAVFDVTPKIDAMIFPEFIMPISDEERMLVASSVLSKLVQGAVIPFNTLPNQLQTLGTIDLACFY